MMISDFSDLPALDAYEMKLRIYSTAAPEPVSWTSAYDDFAEWVDESGLLLRPTPKFRPGDAITVMISPLIVALRPATDDDFRFQELNQQTDESVIRSTNITDLSEWRCWLVTMINSSGQVIYQLHRNKKR